MENTNFDLYISNCENPLFNIDNFINKIKESKIGKYITIKNGSSDGNAVRFRNIFPGTIQFIAYISGGGEGLEKPYCDWKTGFTKIVNSNFTNIGVCLLSHNINADIISSEETEDSLYNSIEAAFYYIVDICKRTGFNITGDELGCV